MYTITRLLCLCYSLSGAVTRAGGAGVNATSRVWFTGSHQGPHWHAINVTDVVRNQTTTAKNSNVSLSVTLNAAESEDSPAYWSSREGDYPPCLILEFN